MSRFANLDKRAAAATPTPKHAQPPDPQEESLASPAPAGRAKARIGKKPVIGYFSEDLSRELRMLSAMEGTTMQALLGEAIDLLMTVRGRNRFNER